MSRVARIFAPTPTPTPGQPGPVVCMDPSYATMIRCPHDSPPLLPQQEQLYVRCGPGAFLITRSKNDNTVVYAPALDGKKAVDVYWMDISRRGGGPPVRSELTWLEKTMAYGASVDGDSVRLVALPHLESVLAPGTPVRLVGTVGRRRCFLLRAYVRATENLIGPPTVQWVNVHGIDCATGEEIVEKRVPG